MTVWLILNRIANGMGQEEILETYPHLVLEEMQATLNYSAWFADQPVYAVERATA
jgi:uncharacterized protein (DUF433 family)